MTNSWDDDDFFFEDEDETTEPPTPSNPWVMLVVDDEPSIHEVTKLALNRFHFEGRTLEFLSAYSAKEAIEFLKAREDIALILLDVVMENDHAGLDCARQIREELDNDLVRIVLRTGQPGQAPEQEVVLAYDINDYRAKTELTSERLFTTVVSALRSYGDLAELESFRNDAYKLLSQNAKHFQSLIDLSDTALVQLGNDMCIQRCNSSFATLMKKDLKDLIGFPIHEIAPETLTQAYYTKQTTSLSLNGQNVEVKFVETENTVCISLRTETPS